MFEPYPFGGWYTVHFSLYVLWSQDPRISQQETGSARCPRIGDVLANAHHMVFDLLELI